MSGSAKFVRFVKITVIVFLIVSSCTAVVGPLLSEFGRRTKRDVDAAKRDSEYRARKTLDAAFQSNMGASPSVVAARLNGGRPLFVRIVGAGTVADWTDPATGVSCVLKFNGDSYWTGYEVRETTQAYPRGFTAFLERGGDDVAKVARWIFRVDLWLGMWLAAFVAGLVGGTRARFVCGRFCLALSLPSAVSIFLTRYSTHWPEANILPTFLVWTLLTFFSALLIFSLRHRQPAIRSAPTCAVCSYDLTGNVSGVCPECGTPILWKGG
jgi:hypothetical protein